MFQFKLKKLGIITGLLLSLLIMGCGQNDVDSTSEAMDYTLTGVEPGAGITELTEQAIDEYESLAGWEQQTSSTGAMLSVLDEAIQNEEPILFAAWTPHYMFVRWDIKFIDDPKGIFGVENYAATLGREGLQDDMPEAYTLLERFYWDIEEVNNALFKAEDEQLEMDVIAKQWVDENEETVAEWTEGIETVDGTPFEIATTIWDDGLFSGNIAKLVLEQQGFDVTLTTLDPTIVLESLSTGEADATLAIWLPTTHGAMYEQYEDEIEEIGRNVEGSRLGFAVPSYMEEDSLEDFEPAE